MARLISIVSGKGGVGKTTVTANLGVALARLGKRTVVVDADIAMANLGMLFGLHSAPITLHDVLYEGVDVHDAMYEGPFGVRVIPSGLTFSAVKSVDPEVLARVVKTLDEEFEYVLLDAPAGVGEGTKAVLSATREAIVVVTPTPPSLADGMKARIVAERMENRVEGAVVNMRGRFPNEPSTSEIVNFLELPVLIEIPEDEEVRKTWSLKNPLPVVARKEDSPASIAFMKLASKLSGVHWTPPKKKSWWERLIGIFKRK